MDFGIAGKRAVVLGSSRGLGAACAEALAAEGVDVVAVSRSGRGDDRSPRVRPVACNLSDPRSVNQLVESLAADDGVDILVNNTGGPPTGAVLSLRPSDWETSFSALAIPLFTIAGALLPGMISRQWGRIITIGSSGIAQPIANLALSNGVRAAVAGWSKTLAAEVAKDGITVNMVLPGRIDTTRVRELDAQKAAKAGVATEHIAAKSRETIPAGRYGRAEEFGAAVAFLASQQASYITGSQIRVDGGMIQAS